MKDFRYSILVTIFCLTGAFFWGMRLPGAGPMDAGLSAVLLALILGVMEVSLSFDNAVVNASVLKDMDAKWQRLFLTVGILIAVFGMRLFFPILIVSIASGQGIGDVSLMALNRPEEYARYLEASHAGIAAFGGMFLLLVFFSYMMDEAKEVHWIAVVEEKLASFGKLDSVEVMCALIVLFLLQRYLPIDESVRSTVLAAGVAGVILYVAVSSLDRLFESEEEGEAAVKSAKRTGIAGFLYLEVLDASFSFDGVIGAFAITRDIVIIMLGLTIGAMFVRSLTVFLVNKGTLDEYVFLEHGAHWAIGALAAIMLGSIYYQVSEIVTGLIGVTFIALAVVSSVRYQGSHADESAKQRDRV
ncbi:DUF475 domain-containing protein [Methylocaldum sp. MU1018]